MGYGTRPHDWKTYELESMKRLSVCPRLLVRVPIPPRSNVPHPIVADQHECQALGLAHAAPTTVDGMASSYLGLFRLYARS
jgi:hypothetical protein